MAAPRHSTQILTATTGGPEENVRRDNRRKMKGEKGLLASPGPHGLIVNRTPMCRCSGATELHYPPRSELD